MSIKHGAIALTAFQITEDMDLARSRLNPEALFIHGFKPIDETPAELVSVGWTGFDDMLDTLCSNSHPQIGEYLAFALRVDQRKISAAVLKKHYSVALRQEEARNREAGKKYVSRERRNELKEQVKIRLLAKAEPVPAMHEVVVNLGTGLVFLGSASPKVAELFSACFANTFKLNLTVIDPYYLTGAPEAGRAFLTRVFSEGWAIHPPIEYNPLSTPGVEIFFAFTDRVVVVDDKAELSGTSKNGADIAEIENGVAAGKEVVKLALRVDWEPDEFTLTLDHNLVMTGLKLPAGSGEGFTAYPRRGAKPGAVTPLSDKAASDGFTPSDMDAAAGAEADDPDGAFLERVFLTERAVAAIHAACKDAWVDIQSNAPNPAASVQTPANSTS